MLYIRNKAARTQDFTDLCYSRIVFRCELYAHFFRVLDHCPELDNVELIFIYRIPLLFIKNRSGRVALYRNGTYKKYRREQNQTRA